MNKIIYRLWLFVLWFITSFGLWLGMLFLYIEIAEPEGITLFERILSGIVSIEIAEKLMDEVFKAKEGTENG